MASTTGQKTSAQALAKPAPAVVVSGSHTFVAMQNFCVFVNGHTVAYNEFTRYVVDSATKALISATTADVVWDN